MTLRSTEYYAHKELTQTDNGSHSLKVAKFDIDSKKYDYNKPGDI